MVQGSIEGKNGMKEISASHTLQRITLPFSLLQVAETHRHFYEFLSAFQTQFFSKPIFKSVVIKYVLKSLTNLYFTSVTHTKW